MNTRLTYQEYRAMVLPHVNPGLLDTDTAIWDLWFHNISPDSAILILGGVTA